VLWPAPRISSKVDVWSLGVVFFQMLFGQRPFFAEGASQEELLRTRAVANLQPRDLTFPPDAPRDAPHVSDEAKAFIRRCLAPNPDERPDVLALCEEPYLTLRLR
jgi:tousled-like kinase